MRLTHTVSALLCAAHSAVARFDSCSLGTGCVYTYDPAAVPADMSRTSELSNLTPERARLVLAQRAGVEDYHIMDDLSEEDVAALNKHGITGSLFGSGREQKPRVSLFYQLSTSESLRTPFKHATDRFFIPFSNDGQQLFRDLQEQAWFSGHISKGDSFVEVHSIRELDSKFEELATSGKYHVTALITPNPLVQLGDWGVYEMPEHHDPLSQQSRKQKRQAGQEQPLSDVPSETGSSFASIQSSTSNLGSSIYASNSSKPIPGILPSCFSSESSCESSTNNCSGHGSCSRKYKDVDAGGDRGDCWVCACETTKSESGRPIYWGGSACQKKDVSMAFWLLASFTIGLVFLITFAVGTIWSMGEEELPSVIGAGVSGPPRR